MIQRPSGQRLCGDRCVTVETDRAHCGARGQGLVCAMGQCALERGATLATCATPGDGGVDGGLGAGYSSSSADFNSSTDDQGNVSDTTPRYLWIR